MKHNAAPKFEACADAGNRFVASRAQLFSEERFDIFCQDPSRRHLRAVPFFRQERLAPETLARALDCILEKQIFESMQRVVVDKDADWALSGQQMRQLINQLAERRAQCVLRAVCPVEHRESISRY